MRIGKEKEGINYKERVQEKFIIKEKVGIKNASLKKSLIFTTHDQGWLNDNTFIGCGAISSVTRPFIDW